jgi:hypothetical protein
VTERGEQQRPTLIWVITVFNLLAIAFGLFAFVAYFLGWAGPRDLAERAYIGHPLRLAGTAALMMLNLAGTLLLFAKRRIAFPLFLTEFAITSTWNLLDPAPGTPVSSTIIPLSLSLSVCVYTYWLLKRGVLR